MTFTDAAAEVLRLAGKPLHYKDITAQAIEKNLLSHVGKSPEVTMGARLAALFKKQGDENPLVRIRPGVFALREWEASGQLKQMVKPTRGGRGAGSAATTPIVEIPEAAEAPESKPTPEPVVEAKPAPVAEFKPVIERRPAPEAVAPVATAAVVEEAKPAAVVEPKPVAEIRPVVERRAAVEPVVSPEPERRPAPAAQAAPPARSEEVAVEEEEDDRSPEEIDRAELAAGASSMFDEEDDDDEPIFGSSDAAGADKDGQRRRRRRRRRSSRSGSEQPVSIPSTGSLPGYTVSPAFEQDEAPEHRPAPVPVAPVPAHPVVLEVASSSLESLPLDDLGGRDMADAIAGLLGAFDRAQGPVSLRQIAEAAQRKARLSGDMQLLQSQIAAAVRADNIRRTASGKRPRFRFSAGRIGLTDWLLTSELVRYEQEAMAAVERYRDAAGRAFARKAAELPGHAFVELVLLAFERMGLTNVRVVRRAGVPNHEAHFSGVFRTEGGDTQVAIVVRRDAREIGRERVTELRGSLHHYGPAAMGWLVTAGQVLSGAREEASVAQAQPITVFDGLAVAKLCENNDVAVLRSRLSIAIPDVDLLEALRST